LVIAAPGVKPGVTDIPVSLVDLAPTLLALVGRPVLPTMQGRPFMDAAGGPVATGRPIYVGGSFFKVAGDKPERQDAIIVWPYKLILYHKRPQDPGEYYNLEADGGERHPRPEDEHAARLRATLQRWQREVNRAKSGAVNGGAAIPDLRALGYVQ
jgi:arylsulfatase A-like enzyme